MLNIKERNANTVQPPEADTVVLFLDAADSKLKLKDSSGDISEVSTNVIGIPDGGATGEVLAKASGDGGDVEWIDPTGGVKEYVALLTQTGTNAPVATILKNTLGGVPVWSYNSVGTYEVELTDIFVDGNTVSSVCNIMSTDDNSSVIYGQTFNQSNSVLEIRTIDNGARANDHNFYVKIEVYP